MRAGAAMGRSAIGRVGEAEIGGRYRRIVAVLLCVIPLSQFPIDVYAPAIPQMVTDLGTTATLVQASVAAYVLGLALGQLPVGILGDARGRKPVLLVCLALLCVASVGTALAANIWMLLVFRFFEGLGGTACMVLVYAIAGDITRGPKLASLSGWLGASWGLAPVIAPAIGGVLVQFLSWRGVFGLVAVLALLALAAAWAFLPETLQPDKIEPVERHRIGQILRDALRHRLFVVTILAFALFGSVQLMFGIVAPLLFETGLGVPPAAYGLIALLVGAANLAGELTTGALAQRVSHRVLGFLYLTSFAIGALVLVGGGVILGLNGVLVTIGGIFALFGCGAICPLMFGRAVGLFDRNHGLISGLGAAITYVFVAIAMSSSAALPDNDQMPLGIVYLCAAVIGFFLFWICLPRRSRA